MSKKKKTPLLEQTISDLKMYGVFSIGVVTDPAIGKGFLALGKNREVLLKTIDKNILMGPVLIPDMLIPRDNYSGHPESNIFFTADTIRKASELFMKKGFQSSTNLNHEDRLSGNTIVESWIVEDPKRDKSSIHGIDAPAGTWMISMKIRDKVLFKAAKTGEITGFSIEGLFDSVLKQQKSNKSDEFDNKILNQIRELLNQN